MASSSRNPPQGRCGDENRQTTQEYGHVDGQCQSAHPCRCSPQSRANHWKPRARARDILGASSAPRSTGVPTANAQRPGPGIAGPCAASILRGRQAGSQAPSLHVIIGRDRLRSTDLRRFPSERSLWPGWRNPHAQFKCPVCRRFVRASAVGMCPQCGFAAPRAPALTTAKLPGSPTRWPLLVLALLIGTATYMLLP